MAITPDSPLAGKSAGNIAKAVAYVAEYGQLDGFTEQYLVALYDFCQEHGIRFELAFAQWCDETDIGRSLLWRTKHNPAGLGALTDGTYVGRAYDTPQEAARAHVIHLWLYVKGVNLPADLKPYVYLDPRWDAAIAKGKAGSAPTLKGLAGSWADNPQYAIQIAAHANKAFGSLPEGVKPVSTPSFSYGLVPKPKYVDDYIPDFPGIAADYIGQRMVLGVVWHRMVGTLMGTRVHFRNPGTGLTDYGIGVAGVDAAPLDGVIYRWNDPLGQRSGWASGKVILPYGDGKAFLNEFSPTYGVDIVNRGQVSIEISGQYSTPLTAKSRAAIVALTSYYADQAHIPWDKFPLWQPHGYSFVRYHQEFTGPAEKVCPGAVVIAETANLIEMCRATLKSYQTSTIVVPPTTIYRPGSVPAWLKDDLAKGVFRDHTWDGRMVRAVNREFMAIRETPRRATASLTSANYSGPPLKKGERFEGCHIFGDWVMTPFGTRIYAKDLSPEVIIKGRAK